MKPACTALIAFSTALFSSSMASMAAGAPPQLLNKTVQLVWQTSGTARNVDGKSIGYSNTNTRTIYISTAGRPFLRAQLGNSRRSRQGDRGPEDASKGSVHFEGNRLVGIETFASGARQFTATFDASFSSCTLTVIDAKAGGAAIKRRGPDGMMYEIDSTATSSPSCSVQNGNAFAGQ